MRIVQASRASAILYNLLVGQQQAKPWLMPANICPIVPITFMKAGVPFELVDISAETLHMDLDNAEALVKTRKFGGLLYAHTYGDESTPNQFFALVESIDSELLKVDDRCLCRPSFDTTSSADVVLFSTGYGKHVELAFGGYAVLHKRMRYRPVALPFRPEHLAALEKQYKSAIQERIHFDYRDSDWLRTDADLPAWDRYRVEIESRLGSSSTHRHQLNQTYSSRLPVEIQLPSDYQQWRFNIRVRQKGKILEAIFAERLFASSHYASLAGIMSDGAAPVAEQLGDEVINLFNDHHFTEEMADRICDIIVKAL
jgi:dTDP-4-amino-4,6-dideoxygalactose transaminase